LYLGFLIVFVYIFSGFSFVASLEEKKEEKQPEFGVGIVNELMVLFFKLFLFLFF
jgi:hypothetical protein